VDDALHVGQAHVAPGKAVGQALVVEAEQVEDRGVQIMDVHHSESASKSRWGIMGTNRAKIPVMCERLLRSFAAGPPRSASVVVCY
jgi:hypothetical protein